METLSSPSPLSSGVYTKGQLQVLASLELLHVLRKGGELQKQSPSEFRGFSWVLLSLVFVGFRVFFVGVRGFSWVFVGFAVFPFCRCSPPLFLFPSPPRSWGGSNAARKEAPPGCRAQTRPRKVSQPPTLEASTAIPTALQEENQRLEASKYLTNSFLRACVAHLPSSPNSFPKSSCTFGALLPCSFEKASSRSGSLLFLFLACTLASTAEEGKPRLGR